MTSNYILNIHNLHASIDDIDILKGINLSINHGEIHAIMGPNGSGKSTLAKIIAGHPSYKINQGSIYFEGANITNEEPENRSHRGIFLAFQYPLEIPGVSNIDFLHLAYNEKLKAEKKEIVDPLSFFDFAHEKAKNNNVSSSFLTRHVNQGFSGGEKKKNEILQMTILNSQLSILDEIDSGLDVDAMKHISKNINLFLESDKSIIIITHYQRLLDYIVPDFVHIMHNGKIIETGTSKLAKEIEKNGFKNIVTVAS